MRKQVYTLGGMDHVEFQQEAIYRLLQRSKEILNRDKDTLNDRDKRMLLYSPVGSGKTVIATTYMEYLAQELGEDLAFVWLSPGEGGLHTQSEDSAKIMRQNLQVLDVQKVLTQKSFKPNDVLFMNWESLRQEGNILRREGEDPYLAECVRNTKGVRLIALVDEAHRARNKDVIDLFNPDLVLDITATPYLKEYKEDNTITVDIQSVINEGIIKKQTHINVGIASNEEDTLLNEAVKKRKELEERYQEITTKKNIPLVLIQLANNNKAAEKKDSKAEQEKVDRVKEKLKNLGVSEDKIGVWLSERHENIEEDIKTSDIEFLIFKQAIATGWNCPRSHILVRLRDIKTETFDLQTIGRILRTVERKHYGDDLVDTAYILTEYETVDYKPTPEFRDKVLTEKNKAVLKDDFKENIGILNLPMNKVIHDLNYVVVTEKLKEYLEKTLDTKAVNEMRIKEEFLEDSFESVTMETKEILSEGTGQVATKQTYELSQYRVDKMFYGYVKKLYPKMDISRTLIKVLKKVVAKKYKAADIRKLYVSNKEELERYIKKAIQEYESYARAKIRQDEDTKYKIQEEVFYPNIIQEVESYTYTKRPDLDVAYTKSKSEEPFAIWLDGRENVEYWFKNGVSKADFSLVYKDKDEIYKEYYPDFFVITKEEGKRKLYILDVKGTLEDGDIDKEGVALKYKAGKVYEEKTKEKINELNKTIHDLEVSMIKYADKDLRVPFICKADKENYKEDITEWVPFEV